MRLTPPEIKKHTFEANDFLNRKPTGDQLTGLIKRIDSPLVIAVDGEWGSGKSHFLKCWKNDPADDITKIYVDAFKQDYLDDPLIALVSALDEALETPTDTPTTSQKAVGKMKKIAPILGRLALRTGISYATLGAVRNIDEYFAEDTESDAEATAKGATKDASKELTKMTNDFWSAENTRKSAMEAFREALVELTQPDDDKKPTHKIAIIVDELDRCRPDYALNMIEVIKHFFEIDGINFVLGVNMSSLENSVQARYGAGIDAKRYLQKFVQVKLELRLQNASKKGAAVEFFDKTIKLLGVADREYTQVLRAYIRQMQSTQSLSLRGIERVITTCIASGLIPNTPRDNPRDAENLALIGLHVLQAFHPELVQKAINVDLSYQEFQTKLKFRDGNPQAKYEHELLYELWELYLGDINSRTYRDIRERTELETGLNPQALAQLISTRLFTISLTGVDDFD